MASDKQDEVWRILREPFPPELVQKLPKPTSRENAKGRCSECGGYHGLPALHLDYVGHAEVTDRLLKADPYWSWEPLAFDQNGLPLFTTVGGKAVGLWIRLTIGGVTRLGYGSVEPGVFDAEKQLIGDAIRNAAMRFGVALDLWSKSDLYFEDSQHSATSAGARGKPAPRPSAPQETPGEATAPILDVPPRHVRPDWMKKAQIKWQEAGLRAKDIPALKLHPEARPTDVENALVAWRVAISEGQPKAGDVWVLEQFDRAIEEAKKIPEGAAP